MKMRSQKPVAYKGAFRHDGTTRMNYDFSSVDTETLCQSRSRRWPIVGKTRGATGHLVIRSNDRTEPSKEIPLFALGDPNPPPASHP